MIRTALRDYLRTIASLQNALGSEEFGIRIFADRIPQGVPLPAVKLVQFSGEANYQLANESACAMALIEVQCEHLKNHLASDLAELVRLAPLSAFWGDMAGTHVLSCTIDNDSTITRVPADGSDQWKFRASTTYRITYQRPQPIKV